jgi:hypothetical protein
MPKYRFPLEAQDDYKGRVYFTQIIEIPPKINTSAFKKKQIAIPAGPPGTTIDGNDVDLQESSVVDNALGLFSGKFTPGQHFVERP